MLLRVTLLALCITVVWSSGCYKYLRKDAPELKDVIELLETDGNRRETYYFKLTGYRAVFKAVDEFKAIGGKVVTGPKYRFKELVYEQTDCKKSVADKSNCRFLDGRKIYRCSQQVVRNPETKNLRINYHTCSIKNSRGNPPLPWHLL